MKLSKKRLILIGVITFLLALVISALVIRKVYVENLRPVGGDNTGVIYTVTPGSAAAEIGDDLKARGLIRSDWAFEWYVRNHELREDLKAGTYLIKKSFSVGEIVDIMVEGKIATDLVTILPEKTLGEIRQMLIGEGFSAAEVDKALDPARYKGHPALTDKPRGASLEGYLYPESFQKTSQTKPSDIIKLSLDEMQYHLTPEIRQAIAKNGLSLHQGITLASIIEQEVTSAEDRAKAAQVFIKRYNEGISLQSDATNKYAKIDASYDTYQIKGLPPGPIGNVTKTSLEAVAYPAGTNWLYFVSGDDGRTHFSKDLQTHQELTKKYCTQLCAKPE